MADLDMKRSIRQAFEHATPDVLPSVLDACNKQKGTVIMMTENKKKRNWIPRIAGLAAAFALVLGLGFGWNFYQTNYVAATTVSLDVNPSISITVNQKERVLDVKALNEDGKAILEGMDFEGSDIDVTVNAIIGSMLRKGYLNDAANSILVSVDCKDTAQGAALQEKLAKEVNALLQTEVFSGAVISQTVEPDDTLESLAEKHGISVGKARLIQRIVAQNTRYAFEDLAPLSINELNLLTESGSLHLDSVTSTGSASDKSYIGADAAKKTALDHAGVAEADIMDYEIDMDLEKGVMVYEIEFDTAEYDYEYDINATTGAVVWSEKEADRNNESRPSVNPGTSVTPTDPTIIGRDAAKKAAADHAGVPADSVTAFECELDRDHGRSIYEIEFISGDYEYDYDIDATTGAVIKHEKQLRDGAPQTNTSPAIISKEDAKAAAIAHAGVTADSLKDYECELDKDNSAYVYEIDFQSGAYEYEYKINAATGAEIRFHKERDDDYVDSSASAAYISKEEAKAAALTHAGLSADAIRDLEIELDTEKGTAVYEVDFESAGIEYSYKIDAVSGAVLRSEKDTDN